MIGAFWALPEKCENMKNLWKIISKMYFLSFFPSELYKNEIPMGRQILRAMLDFFVHFYNFFVPNWYFFVPNQSFFVPFEQKLFQAGSILMPYTIRWTIGAENCDGKVEKTSNWPEGRGGYPDVEGPLGRHHELVPNQGVCGSPISAWYAGNRRGKRCFWTCVPSRKPQIEPVFSQKRDRFSIFPDRCLHNWCNSKKTGAAERRARRARAFFSRRKTRFFVLPVRQDEKTTISPYFTRLELSVSTTDGRFGQ